MTPDGGVGMFSWTSLHWQQDNFLVSVKLQHQLLWALVTLFTNTLVTIEKSHTNHVVVLGP